jgi:uncharacterized membrane protein YbhN (UPF0104 family)
LTVVAIEPGAAPGDHRTVSRRQVLGSLLSFVLVAAVIFWFLPQFTSLGDVWASIRSMTWLELTLLGVAALWNLISYQFVMVATMPGQTLRQAFVSTETTTAVSNTVVGGAAISLGLTYAMNSSWGFSRSRTSVSLLLSGLWNNFAKLGLPVLALVLLTFESPPSTGRPSLAKLFHRPDSRSDTDVREREKPHELFIA